MFSERLSQSCTTTISKIDLSNLNDLNKRNRFYGIVMKKFDYNTDSCRLIVLYMNAPASRRVCSPADETVDSESQRPLPGAACKNMAESYTSFTSLSIFPAKMLVIESIFNCCSLLKSKYI